MEILSNRAILRPADPDAALAFYRDVLGLAIYREFPGGTVFFLGNGLLEVSGKTDRASSEHGLQLWLQVRDLDAVHRELAGAGVEILREPRREPWGLDEMWVADPDGTRIVFVRIPPEHPIRRDDRAD
ncbi:MAG: VOC family protein [Actinomycetota bacterium]|nr:VOC family protein [Actinomycetota bacterium]